MSSSSSSRPSFQATCPDYPGARRALGSLNKESFAWLEAVHLSAQSTVWPAPAKDALSIAYVVHSAQSARDVPEFAIEVHQSGVLLRYETERAKINQWACMSETDRQVALRAQNARSEASPANAQRAAMQP